MTINDKEYRKQQRKSGRSFEVTPTAEGKVRYLELAAQLNYCFQMQKVYSFRTVQ